MKHLLYYCYDAYCGWCYGFSSVINRLISEHNDKFEVEVLSGGMILPENPRHIRVTAGYIQKAYKKVEAVTGVKFGDDYLWHIFHPDKSDWHPNSEKPAIALCIFKDYFPEMQVRVATDLQYALHFEGRDLVDDEAYRHLLEKYYIPTDEFFKKLRSEEYKEKAYYEFALVKQFKVTGYPTLLLQATESRFYLLASGYTDYKSLTENIESSLQQMKIST